MLNEISVYPFTKEYGFANRIITESFPKNEQIPVSLLAVSGLRSCVDFTAYREEKRLIGITYTINTKSTVFLLYLAVDSNARGGGYGSEILCRLRQKSEGKTIIFNVEVPDDSADNAQQRIKRIAFYEKNNFHKTNHHIIDNGYQYLIMSSDEYTIEQYKEVLKKATFGFYDPIIL